MNRNGENTKMDALEGFKKLFGFMSRTQIAIMASNMRGEEKQFFIDKVCEMGNLVASMPHTYQQDGKGEQAIAYLHYFHGGFDWYITEKDMSATAEKPEQMQAFGLACMHENELSYIYIDELIKAGVELDLHFTPRPLAECRKN